VCRAGGGWSLARVRSGLVPAWSSSPLVIAGSVGLPAAPSAAARPRWSRSSGCCGLRCGGSPRSTRGGGGAKPTPSPATKVSSPTVNAHTGREEGLTRPAPRRAPACVMPRGCVFRKDVAPHRERHPAVAGAGVEDVLRVPRDAPQGGDPPDDRPDRGVPDRRDEPAPAADNGDGAAWFAMVPTDRDGLVRAITDFGAGWPSTLRHGPPLGRGRVAPLTSRFHGGACEGPCRTGRKVL